VRTVRRSLTFIAVALGAFAAPALAQDSSPANATGLRKEIISQIDDAQQKMVALANAVPQDKYGYRPAAGVRSVSEVFMHVVGANIFLARRFAGVTRDPGVQLTPDMETKVTDKAQVTDLLRKSFEYAKQAVMDVPEAEMNAAVSMFGQQTTKRGVLVTIATHAHEHLGQSIAYARANNVVPPWSQARGGE
jgi:uncharacterized damage-inducible protein DinB